MSSSLLYSVIIPAYNEAALLPRLLDSIDAARKRRGIDDIEVVVADNSSTDNTAALAHERGAVVAPVARRSIAAARNGGARAATGDVLCFVDADSQVHLETFVALDRVLSGGRVLSGATGVRMERLSPGIIVALAMTLPFVKIVRANTGVVFCTRAVFDATGGYEEDRLVAEDVIFFRAMRAATRRLGARTVTDVRDARSTFSTRKFDEHGDWHWIWLQARAAVAFAVSRRRGAKYIERYWYTR